jgi:dihydrofolate reductase
LHPIFLRRFQIHFKTIGRALPKRRNIVYSNEPINVPGIEVTSLAPQELVAKLEKEGVEELAICGGSTIYTMFMKASLVDSLYLTIEPVIFGKGMSLFNDVIDAKLELVNFRRTDSGTIFNEYKVIK